MRTIRLFSFNLLLVCIAPALVSSAMADTLSAKIGFKMVQCGVAGKEKCARAALYVNPGDYEALGVDPIVHFYYYKGHEMNDESAPIAKTGDNYWMEGTGSDGGDNPKYISHPEDHHFFILNQACLGNECQPVHITAGNSSAEYKYKTVLFPVPDTENVYVETAVGFRMVECYKLGQRRCAKTKILISAESYEFLQRPKSGKYKYSTGLSKHILSASHVEYNYDANNYKLVVTDRNSPSKREDLHFFTLYKVCLNYDCVNLDIKAGSAGQPWQYATHDFPRQGQDRLAPLARSNTSQSSNIICH